MFKHIYFIDDDGYFLRDYMLEEGLPTPPNSVDVPLPNGMFTPKFNFETKQWEHGISQAEINKLMGRDMPTLRANKDAELNAKCNEAILAGFTHVINGVTYWFSYDMEAQGNFRDAKEILSDGILAEVPWTVRIGNKDGEYARVPINLAVMNELTIVIMMHKTEKISKYRDFLMPLVEGATTPEELEEIQW